MPPKKRPATASATTSAAKRKKVSIGRTSVMGVSDAMEPETESHASGRPKRSSIGEPTYNTSTTTAKKSATSIKPTKSEGPKSASQAKIAMLTRGRGRPRKDAADATVPTKSSGKPVGRPRKSSTSKFTRVKSHTPVVQIPKQARNKATRTPTSVVAPAPTPTTTPGGRPKSTTTKTTAKAKTNAAAPAAAARTDKPPSKTKSTKAKEKTAGPQTALPEEADGLTANESDWDEGEDDGKQYWLMKAEPDSRLENGVDVGFSVDDLMNAKEPEGWDGVRNVVARNRMRAMRQGDRAFFYHSNTKVPGVAGIMEIVEEHSIDESAFNPTSPYYDPKSSRDQPKWELVHVRFVRKLSELIPLSELRKHGQPGGVLQDLEMLKQSRLSVSAVKPKEWHFILGLATDDDLDDEPGNLATVRGQIGDDQEKVVRGVKGGAAVNGHDTDRVDEAGQVEAH